MRLGWAKKGNSISYYVHKTIHIDGKNKSLVKKRFGSGKNIYETYGVTDAKAWANGRWIKEKSAVNENGNQKTADIEQLLIVSCSIKYRNYLRTLRNGHLEN